MPIRIFLLIIVSLLFKELQAQPLSIVSPKLNQSLNKDAVLSWNSTTDGAYILQLSENQNLQPLLINDTLDVNQISLSFAPNKGYYWRVILLHNSIVIDSSNLSYFYFFRPNINDSLALWLVANENTTVVNNKISEWIDLSSDTQLLSQANSSRRPTLIQNSLNGYDIASFDNSVNFFNTTTSLDSSDFLITSVYSTKDSTNRASRTIRGSNNWLMGSYTGFYRLFNGAFLNAQMSIPNRFVIHTALSKNDTLRNYLNNQYFNERVGGRVPGQLTLGSNAGDFFNGDLAEVVVYNSQISELKKDSIEFYLMDKYSPPINLGLDRTICSFPDSVEVDIDYALNFQWSTGDTTSKTIIDSAGKYYLTITDMFERTSIDSIVFYQDTNNYVVNFGFTDTTICRGDSILITAGPDQYQYQWSSNDQSNSLFVSTEGTYRVTVTNCFSIVSVDSFRLILNEPRFTLGGDTIGCFNNLPIIFPDSSFTNVSYLWSTNENSSTIIADTSGVYSLRVTDNFQCSFSDSIQVVLDSSLFSISLGNDTSLCMGNFFGLEVSDTSITSFLWSTGNTLPQQVLDTAGLYKLTVSNQNCQNSDSIQIAIQGDAPNANFLFSNLCFKDSVNFQSISTAPIGDTLISFYWEFGDGSKDSIGNTKHRYDSLKLYRVLLEIVTDKGCSDTISRIIQIDPKPRADFFEDKRCSKTDILFSDNSSIQGGNISSYFWNFGDTTTNSDTSRNAFEIYIYDTLGTYNISLEVTTSDGCKDTTVKSIPINPSPIPAYTTMGNCFGDSTTFMNQSTIAQGSITNYLWLMNGQQLNEENPKIRFFNSGVNNLALSLQSDSNCNVTLIDAILINPKPTARFTVNSVCEEEPFAITNAAIPNGDTISNYLYTINGPNFLDSSILANPVFNPNDVGAYQIKQIVSSINGCTDSISISTEILENPISAFRILNNGNGVPYRLEVENLSTNNDINLWLFGTGDSSPTEIPNYIYSDTGDYQLQLIVESINGCRDTLERTLTVTPYFLDAAIQELELQENNSGFLNLRVRLLNVGNNTIDDVQLIATLNNQLSIEEYFQESIYKGDSKGYLFSSAFAKGDNDALNFVCVRIGNVNGLSDEVANNNQLCEEGFSSQFFIQLYPNPSSSNVNIEYVLPEDGNLSILLYDALGRKLNTIVDNSFFSKGFYTSILDVSILKSGIYRVAFRYNGVEEVKSIVVQ